MPAAKIVEAQNRTGSLRTAWSGAQNALQPGQVAAHQLEIDERTHADRPGALDINADATISLGRFGVGDEITMEARPDRATLPYVVEGAVDVGRERLGRRNQVRTIASGDLEVRAIVPAVLMMLESAL